MSKLTVTFRSLGRSQREWTADFDMGSVEENRAAALKAAFDNRCTIVRSGGACEYCQPSAIHESGPHHQAGSA